MKPNQFEKSGSTELASPIVGGEIVAQDVSKSYEVDGEQRLVIHGCSLTVERGKLTVMIGPSGCGKSTLIRLLAGFEKPSSGAVLVNGKEVRRPNGDCLVVFQETALFDWMTTRDNVFFGPRVRGTFDKAMLNKANALLAYVGLEQFQGKYPTQLSGGMQRRAELARAMINNPDVMVLDEPFRGLDAMTKKLMQEYYARIFAETRRTTLFITTDIDEAIFLADRILIMTNMPMRVRASINVTLPRPRRLIDVFDSDAGNAIKMQALTILHEEAMKSFSQGSAAATDFMNAYSMRVDRTQSAGNR